MAINTSGITLCPMCSILTYTGCRRGMGIPDEAMGDAGVGAGLQVAAGGCRIRVLAWIEWVQNWRCRVI